jgi:diguanylate cyclase (GGDEF)-like protein/PAS domain S-box-containing protein
VDLGDKQLLQQTLQTNKYAKNFECRQFKKDGSVFWVSLNIQLIRNSEDNSLYYQGYVNDITERKTSENKLNSLLHEFDTVFNSTRDAMFLVEMVDRNTFKYIRTNRSHQESTGLKLDSIRNKTPQELLGKDAGQNLARNYRRCIESGTSLEYEETLDLPGGVATWQTTLTPVYHTDLTYIVGSSQNITERKLAEKELMEAHERLNLAFKGSNTALWDWHIPSGKTVFNEQWAAMIGYTLSDLEPTTIQTWIDLCDPEDLSKSNNLLHQHFSGNSEIYECEIHLRHKEGHWIWALDQGKVVEWDEKGKPVRMIGIHTDITRLQHYVEQLKYQSFHDPLTGLYNRNFLEKELERYNKGRDYPICILSIDMDGLKLVNDSFGHEYGDEHLKNSARLLKESFRVSDILARAGGDEFIALLPVTTSATARDIVKRIQDRIKNYNRLTTTDLPLSLSIGLACADSAEKNLIEVYKCSDDRMYQNKLGHRRKSRAQLERAIKKLLQERDYLCSGHADRVEALSLKVGQKLSLSNDNLAVLKLLSRFHDLGNVSISKEILFKPTSLNKDEWEIVSQHPAKGYRIAQNFPELNKIADLILKHHERWDGKGYPSGLKGEKIPLECRIMAIADAFDVMTSERSYKRARTQKEALEEIRKNAGTQFDPQISEIFLDIAAQSNSYNLIKPFSGRQYAV